jgi:exopolyphosphatase/pppGpp-phosphohydrolase
MKKKDKIEKEKIEKLLNKKSKIKVINPNTGDTLFIRSIYEMPFGFVVKTQKYFTKEERKKMSESAKARGAPITAYRDKRGKNNPMYGKKHSIETRKKISLAMKKKLNNNESSNNS